MFKLLDNGQVMCQEKGDNYVVWTHYGMEKQVKKIETETHDIYKWQEFDLEQGCYVDDTTNSNVIRVNGTDYIPVDGSVEIAKS